MSNEDDGGKYSDSRFEKGLPLRIAQELEQASKLALLLMNSLPPDLASLPRTKLIDVMSCAIGVEIMLHLCEQEIPVNHVDAVSALMETNAQSVTQSITRLNLVVVKNEIVRRQAEALGKQLAASSGGVH